MEQSKGAPSDLTGVRISHGVATGRVKALHTANRLLREMTYWWPARRIQGDTMDQDAVAFSHEDREDLVQEWMDVPESLLELQDLSQSVGPGSTLRSPCPLRDHVGG